MRRTIKLLMLISIFFWDCKSNNANPNEKNLSAKNSSDTSHNETDLESYKYDLAHPQKKYELPQELFEISGNAWVDKNHLLIIEDLHPNLYLIRLENNKGVIEKTVPFKEETPDKKFDVEDVTLVNGTAYALWSHGKIFKVSNWQNKPVTQEIKTFLSKDNNTEGICYDPVSHNILIACKNESDVEDEKKSTRAIYQFDLSADTLMSTPFMLIHKKDFKKETDEDVQFFPSAIAVHPVTHDIYILSTKDTKCMAVFSHSGKLKSFELIDKELLPQPEGICFAPDGSLFISTEGKKGETGYIFEFHSKK
jgi:hypothetical protein